MNKCRAKKIEMDGICFNSKKQMQRYKELLYLQMAGEITGLRLHVPYTLIPSSPHGKAIRYIADFIYFDCRKKSNIIEDVKEVRTQVYRIKKRLMAELGNEIIEI